VATFNEGVKVVGMDFGDSLSKAKDLNYYLNAVEV
jgi:hypothetical protein